jgi:CRP-like cAMP-binding protein
VTVLNARPNLEVLGPNAPLFAALDPESGTLLRAHMAEVRLSRGQVLFREGDPADVLYVISSGKIKFARRAGGRESLLAVLGPGEMFGELSLLDPGPRTTTATAVVDACVFALGERELRAWIDGHPAMALALLRHVAGRLRRTQEMVGDLVFRDVPGRVAATLLVLARQFGIQRPDGLHVVHDLTQTELAQLVGASREAVNKILADFGARGWIRLLPRAVVLTDLERLQRRAQ